MTISKSIVTASGAHDYNGVVVNAVSSAESLRRTALDSWLASDCCVQGSFGDAGVASPERSPSVVVSVLEPLLMRFFPLDRIVGLRLFVLTLALTVPVRAAQPIRLQVIPFGSSPASRTHQFDGVLSPPPPPSFPLMGRRSQSDDVDSAGSDVDESDWLMD